MNSQFVAPVMLCLPIGLRPSGARVVDVRSHLSVLFTPALLEYPQDADNRTVDQYVKAS